MRIASSIISVAVFFSLSALAKSPTATPLKKDAKGNIYVPAVEMSHPSGFKVLLLGMVHQGFPEYYKRTLDVAEKWIARGTTRVTILREFFTCQTSAYANPANPDPTRQQLEAVAAANIDFEPTNFIQSDETKLQSLINALKISKVPCQLDVDGKTMRPAYYVKRNQDGCRDARKHGGSCQWADFDIANSEKVLNVEGDLNMDKESAGMQLVGASLFNSFRLYKHEKVASSFSLAPYYVILDYRNWHTVNIAHERMSIGDQRLILPWGAAHTIGFVELFQQMGFKITEVQDVLFYRPSDKGRWPQIDQQASHPEVAAGDRYDFEVGRDNL